MAKGSWKDSVADSSVAVDIKPTGRTQSRKWKISIALAVFATLIALAALALGIVVVVKLHQLGQGQHSTPATPIPPSSGPGTGNTESFEEFVTPSRPPFAKQRKISSTFVDPSVYWQSHFADVESESFKKQANFYAGKIYMELVKEKRTLRLLNTTEETWFSVEINELLPLDETKPVAGVQVFFTVAQNAANDDATLITTDSLEKKVGLVVQSSWKSIDTIAPAWKSAAEMFRVSMNFNSDPCDDFFEYACGGYISNYQTSARTLSRLEEMTVATQSAFLGKLQEMTQPSANPTPAAQDIRPETVKKALQVFKSCYAASNDEISKNVPLLQLLSEFGGWPIMDPSWQDVDIPKLAGEVYKRFGVGALFTPFVLQDRSDVSRNVLHIQEMTSIFNNLRGSTVREYMIQSYYPDAIQTSIKYLAGDANVTLDRLKLKDDAVAIAKLEAALSDLTTTDSANLLNPFLSRKSDEYQRVTLDDAAKRWPSLNLPVLLETMYGGSRSLTDAIKSSYLIVMQTKYLNGLEALLKATNKQTVANYILWRLINDLSVFLDKPISAAVKKTRDLAMNTNVQSTTRSLPTDTDSCLTLLNAAMPQAAARLYADAIFPVGSDRMKNIEAMIGYLKQALEASISQSELLDQKSRDAALEKIRQLVAFPGYPHWVTDSAALDSFHAKLDIEGKKTFLEVKEQLARWTVSTNFEKLLVPATREFLYMSPAQLGAFYVPNVNSIYINAAILADPIFNKGYLKAINYGSVGTIVGHELTHAFDTAGSQFSWNGTKEDWLSVQSQSKFDAMAGCVKKQYADYCHPLEEEPVAFTVAPFNGTICEDAEKTVGENIADSGGIRQAFMAYRNWVKANGPEPRLPGLEQFSPEQLFFLSFGNAFCGRYSDDRLVLTIQKDTHAPWTSRVNGPLRNFEGFGKAFKCKQGGSKMWPGESTKCYVWANNQ